MLKGSDGRGEGRLGIRAHDHDYEGRVHLRARSYVSGMSNRTKGCTLMLFMYISLGPKGSARVVTRPDEREAK